MKPKRPTLLDAVNLAFAAHAQKTHTIEAATQPAKPVAPRPPRHSNPAKNAIRRIKADIGARQYRRRMKALRALQRDGLWEALS